MIREATDADFPRMVAMGKRFLAETEYAGKLSFDAEQMMKFGAQMKSNPAAVMLVVEQDGDLVGMLALLVYPHPFSGESTAVELFWWIEPEHRGIGRELLKHGEDVAAARGAKRMQVIAPNERVAKLYRRRGYAHVEDTYQRDI